MNLAVNARDAMPEGGVLTIEARRGAAEDGHILLSVSDTGEGMDEDTRKRLFEPFFTTKPNGKGTGLGLSAVHNLVSQSGGQVDVDSAPGQGSTFRIRLLRADSTGGETDGPRSSPAKRPQRVGTILLVEDDNALSRLLVRVLKRRAHDVLIAESAEEATADLSTSCL
ncbi:MAG: ATP-binding protein [Gammaproteobacteria bacterium]|nr:ATP-binding protein [Gammaproteobacteria bacterium]